MMEQTDAKGLMDAYLKAKGKEVVAVVRCKDCRWRIHEQPGMVYCPNVMGNWVEDNWFCADGERREDGNHRL